jgi:hypothetical protein
MRRENHDGFVLYVIPHVLQQILFIGAKDLKAEQSTNENPAVKHEPT